MNWGMTFLGFLKLAGFLVGCASLLLAAKSVKLLTYNGMLALFLAAGEREMSGQQIAKKLGYVSVFSMPTLFGLEREGIIKSRWEKQLDEFQYESTGKGRPGRRPRRRMFKLTGEGRRIAEAKLGFALEVHG